MEWLLTGDGPKRPDKVADLEAETLTRQFKELVVRHPSIRPLASGFMEWIDHSAIETSSTPVTQPVYGQRPIDDSVIPVLGPIERVGDEIERLAMIGGTAIHDQSREFLANADPGAAVDLCMLERFGNDGAVVSSDQVPVARYRDAESPTGHRDFITAAAFRDAYSDAVGWEVGNSGMEPQFAPDDIVLTSPTAMAIAGQPAVARLESQSGLLLRIYHREGGDVLLIPANSRLDVTRVTEHELVYAYRVIGVVRRG